jgi:hypothetical protein
MELSGSGTILRLSEAFDQKENYYARQDVARMEIDNTKLAQEIVNRFNAVRDILNLLKSPNCVSEEDIAEVLLANGVAL